MEKQLFFCKKMYVKKRGELVILNNRENGSWLKLTKECYKILEHAVNMGWNKEILFQQCYDNEDKEYFQLLIGKLESLGLILECTINDYNSISSTINTITLTITKNCNLRCLHCALSAQMDFVNLPTFEQITYVIDQILKINPKQLIITGGEPMVRKDFFEIIKYIRKKSNVDMELMTNATLISEENVNFLVSNFQAFSISIDGYDEKTCSNIRGRGVFEKVINAITLLKREKAKNIILSCVGTKENDFHYEEFKILCNKLGVEYMFRRLAPIGRGEENYEMLIGTIMEQINIQKIKTTPKIKTMLCKESSLTTGLSSTVCEAFSNSFVIGSDLHIYPCSALYLDEFKGDNIMNVGNLKEYFQKEKYKQTNAYKLYNNILYKNIKPCKNCLINFICNNCPLYVYLYKKIGILDEYCKFKKYELENEIW